MLMQRYHFDLIDSFNVNDERGSVLDGDDQARRFAHKLVHEVRARSPELIGHGYEVRIRNESGDEVSRVPVDQSSENGQFDS